MTWAGTDHYGNDMERKRAMAMAATVTCVLGSATVALAATAGMPVLGFGHVPRADAAGRSPLWDTSTSAQARPVVTRTKDVYDRVVVDAPRETAVRAAPDATMAAPTVPGTVPAVRAAPLRRHASAPHRLHHVISDEAPHTPTDGASTTSPEPPVSPDCDEPQLERNGVWNCQDD